MTPLRKRFKWQALALVTLMLIAYLSEAAPDGRKKKKRPGKHKNCEADIKTCTDCILVKTKHIDIHVPPFSVRDINNRSIVPWTYEKDLNNSRFPSVIYKAKCSNYCKDFTWDLNAVPIDWEIQVLEKQKNHYILKKMSITVGCTCVKPEIEENN